VRQLRTLIPLLSVLLFVAGCLPGAAEEPGAVQRAGEVRALDGGDGWIVVEQGRRVPTPPPAAAPSRTPSRLPTLSPVPIDTSCAFNWLAGQVLIPVTVNVAAGGSATVSWPRVGDPPPLSYRVAVVPQTLVNGVQPEPVWRTVAATSGCAASTTFAGLVVGDPYVFWLDAPEAGHQPDGTPRPRHGRSTVVHAR
jgi:hypothetical protein